MWRESFLDFLGCLFSKQEKLGIAPPLPPRSARIVGCLLLCMLTQTNAVDSLVVEAVFLAELGGVVEYHIIQRIEGYFMKVFSLGVQFATAKSSFQAGSHRGRGLCDLLFFLFPATAPQRSLLNTILVLCAQRFTTAAKPQTKQPTRLENIHVRNRGASSRAHKQHALPICNMTLVGPLRCGRTK